MIIYMQISAVAPMPRPQVRISDAQGIVNVNSLFLTMTDVIHCYKEHDFAPDSVR